MKKKWFCNLTGAAAVTLSLGISCTAFAASSISHPGSEVAAEAARNVQADVENRTEAGAGKQAEVKFTIRNIRLDAAELELDKAALTKLLEPVVHREITLEELNKTVNEITVYCRSQGYPAAAAFLPPQESNDGTVTIQVIPGRYGEIKLDNQSSLKDTVAEGFTKGLKSGDIIRTRKLETALYSLSEVVGTKTVGVLSPGKEFGTSDLTVRLNDPEKKNTTVAYVENYGSSSSGRYRYGLQESLYNLSGMGDKASLGILFSNRNLHNYYGKYEFLIGRGGTTLGIGYSRMDYQTGYEGLGGDTDGTADTISIFGSRPLLQQADKKLMLTYGFDHRRLQDNLKYGIAGTSFVVQNEGEKQSNAVHVGVNGYAKWPTTNLSYDAKLTAGNLTGENTLTVSSGTQKQSLVQDAGTRGAFAKMEGSVQAVQSLGHSSDVLMKLSGQKASRNLDSSEQFYLGGANGVRAYPQGEGMGDDGWIWTTEFRYHTDIPGLALSAYYDLGHTYNRWETGRENMTLSGWGLGVSYSNPGDWFARLDYARRIGLDPNASKDAEASGRLWFMLGKIW